MAFPLSEYLGRIPSWDATRPNFMKVASLVCAPFVDRQNVLESMRTAFDVDTAEGVLLDAVGYRVGVTRIVSIPLSNPYFSWDTAGLGWDQGVWRQPFDPTTGSASLDDYHFRILIKAKIASNNWDGTVEEAAQIFQSILADEGGLIVVQANMDMSMNVGISGIIPTPTTWALISGGVLDLKPGAVRVKQYSVISVPNTPLFGFDVDNQFIGGWDQGSWGVSSVPNT